MLKDVQLTKRDRIVYRNINSGAPTTRTSTVRSTRSCGSARARLSSGAWATRAPDIWYRLKLDGTRFHVVAEDSNPVGRVWSADRLTLPPAKRYDVLVQGHGDGVLPAAHPEDEHLLADAQVPRPRAGHRSS